MKKHLICSPLIKKWKNGICALVMTRKNGLLPFFIDV